MAECSLRLGNVAFMEKQKDGSFGLYTEVLNGRYSIILYYIIIAE